MGNQLTVSMQYGQNSMYNEIEHSDSHSDSKELCKLKVQLCQDLPHFSLDFWHSKGHLFNPFNEDINHQFILSYPSPPPKFIG